MVTPRCSPCSCPTLSTRWCSGCSRCGDKMRTRCWQKPSASKRLKPHAEVKVRELLTHNLYQHRSMQQLEIQDDPRAYLEANINTVRIQDVEDSWSESITFVSGQPALTDKVIHDTFCGHDDGELFHQPAALRGGTVVPHLWESMRKDLQVKGDFRSGETLIGCFNRWWGTRSVDYIHCHTNLFHRGIEWAIISFLPWLPTKQDVDIDHTLGKEAQAICCWAWGEAGHLLQKVRKSNKHWPTWKQVHFFTTLPLLHWPPPVCLLQTHFFIFSTSSTAHF